MISVTSSQAYGELISALASYVDNLIKDVASPAREINYVSLSPSVVASTPGDAYGRGISNDLDIAIGTELTVINGSGRTARAS